MSHPTCVVVEDGEICGRAAHDKTRGLCNAHHTRILRYDTTDPSTRGMRHPKLRDAEWLRERYVNRKMSINRIADGEPFHSGSVRRALLRMGIPIRTQADYARHGHARSGRSPSYNTWGNMLGRCTSPSATGYETYGGRGITVCARWNPLLGGSFENFLDDMGERPEGKTIDRIDVNGNYEPGNCRWATPTEQQHNRRCERCRARKELIHELLSYDPAKH